MNKRSAVHMRKELGRLSMAALPLWCSQLQVEWGKLLLFLTSVWPTFARGDQVCMVRPDQLRQPKVPRVVGGTACGSHNWSGGTNYGGTGCRMTDTPYLTMMGWLRCFSLLKSSIMCIHGSRSRSGHPGSSAPADLVLPESRVSPLPPSYIGPLLIFS